MIQKKHRHILISIVILSYCQQVVMISSHQAIILLEQIVKDQHNERPPDFISYFSFIL